MDEIDKKIIKILSENSRISNSEISKQVFLSIPAVGERIKKLEEKNIIEKYTIRTNRNKLGYKLLAIIFVNIDDTEKIKEFREKITEMEEVIECLHMAGEYDYLLKILVRDTEELEDFLSNKMKSIKGVGRSNTMISLSTLKDVGNR